MESGQFTNKGMKVEIQVESDNMSSGGAVGTKCQVSAGAAPGLTRQRSVPKSGNCLCSPTSHAGSFRCRLHRVPSLQRTKSIDSTSMRDSSISAIKVNERSADHNNAASNANTVEAQQSF